MKELKKFILDNELGEYYENISFKSLTTIKCGGNIALVFYPYTIKYFIKFYEFIRMKDIPYFIIGNGSNLLASDKAYEGVVISFKKLKDKIAFESYKNETLLRVHAGIQCPVFARILTDRFLTGGEALATIPATIGGIVAMNASCYDYKTSDYLLRALIIDEEGMRWYKNYELELAYRKSIVLKRKMIVLGAEFVFPKGRIENIIRKTKQLKEERKTTQPIGLFSAGSTFKNPNNDKAWKLISEAGLQGYQYKDVMISSEHANYIVNLGKAESNDVLKVIKHIKETIKRERGIVLEEEWVFFNFKE